MKFFFPDSQDQIDPSFDFESEERSPHRVRQRDDLYAHEVLGDDVYSGILISKAVVDGIGGSSGRYSLAQRQRLYRVGAKEFLRLEGSNGRRLETMGDCGAFTYVKEAYPVYSIDEVIDYYEGCRFDIGVSIDHVILGYDDKAESGLPGIGAVPEEWTRRQGITLDLADRFLKAHKTRKCKFTPMGIAQGWSRASYAASVKGLQKMGYRKVALGGMVALKTPDILACLQAIDQVRKSKTEIHLFGVTRIEHVKEFARYGVTSFDSTSPFRRAFKDERDNYFTNETTYTAIRVPQVDANPKLKKLIRAGEVEQERALRLERTCLEGLARYDGGAFDTLEELVASLHEYGQLIEPKKDRREAYRRTLREKPWKDCDCPICKAIGIHVVIFRGTERNKRRGFHNLYTFNQGLQRELGRSSERTDAPRQQTGGESKCSKKN